MARVVRFGRGTDARVQDGTGPLPSRNVGALEVEYVGRFSRGIPPRRVSLGTTAEEGPSVSGSDGDGNDGGGVRDFLLDLLKWVGAALVFGLLLYLYRRISRP